MPRLNQGTGKYAMRIVDLGRISRYLLLGSILLLAQAARPENRIDSLRKRIDSWLRQVYPPDGPGAAIFVREQEATILRKGYGLASLQENIPITPGTSFRIGSITKQFTAAGILILVGDGDLSIDSPIDSFFPSLKDRGITIRHLLTHTSGLRNYTQAPSFLLWSQRGMSKSQLLEFLETNPQEFAPGTNWSYCDSGYFLLGLVIEEITGMSYERFVTCRIFSPLGMTHSYFGAGTLPQAKGYRVKGLTFEESKPVNQSAAYSAGALVTTIDDLARWDAALYDSRLLRSDLRSLAFSPYKLMDGKTTSYGFGWLVHRFYGEVFTEHGGIITGFECHVIRIHRRQIFIVVLSNSQNRTPSPDFVATKIASFVLGRPYEPSKKRISAGLRRDLQGSYLVPTRGIRCVEVDGERIYFKYPYGKRREMMPVDSLDYSFSFSFNRVRFVANPLGGISGFIFYGKYGEALFGAKVQDAYDLCGI